MSLNLTPVTSNTLSLTPINPAGVINSTYGQAVYGVNPYGSIGGSGALTLTPVAAGSLTLTPDPTS